MPKATLTFNLPEEQDEWKLINQAGSLHSALWDFSQYLRQRLKYEEISEAEAAVLEAVRTKFWELAQEHNIADLL